MSSHGNHFIQQKMSQDNTQNKKFREKKGESLMSFSLIIIIASVAILLFAFFFVLVVELLFFLC